MASRDNPALEASGNRRVRGHRVRSGAKALITTESRVLLVEERHADGSKFWTLPGGGVRGDELPVEALRRELVEELSCRSAVNERITSVWYVHQDGVTVSQYRVFDCSLLSAPTPNRGEGVLGCRWVVPESPPASTLPVVRQLLRSRGSG